MDYCRGITCGDEATYRAEMAEPVADESTVRGGARSNAGRAVKTACRWRENAGGSGYFNGTDLIEDLPSR